MECTIFHTVENRDNPNDVECNAPFLCSHKDAWLGKGYYFWETFVELAHWWGLVTYNNHYFICKSFLSCCDSDILDLVGNTSQIEEIKDLTKSLQTQYSQTLTVAFVIKWMKKNLKNFSYKAIRVHAINSVKDKSIIKWRFSFNGKNKSYLDLCPAIQICVIDKSIISLPLKIMYPEEYCAEYVI